MKVQWASKFDSLVGKMETAIEKKVDAYEKLG
jgi:hypothetical protein